MLCTKVSFDRWFFKKCKDVIWVGWKRINEDGQMGGEPIKKNSVQQYYTSDWILNHILKFSDYQKIKKIRSLEIC